MSSYEIEIYNMTDDDMVIITNALHAAGITEAGDDEVGAYLCDNKLNKVYVAAGEVGAAVEVINALGFQTDEDEHENELYDWEK